MKAVLALSVSVLTVALVAPMAFSKADSGLMCSKEQISGRVVEIDTSARTMKLMTRGGRTPIWQTVGIDSQVSEAELEKIHKNDLVQVEVTECHSTTATKIASS